MAEVDRRSAARSRQRTDRECASVQGSLYECTVSQGPRWDWPGTSQHSATGGQDPQIGKAGVAGEQLFQPFLAASSIKGPDVGRLGDGEEELTRSAHQFLFAASADLSSIQR